MGHARRLVTILAADAAGYSRLAGSDEEGTVRRLKALRRVIDRLIGAHEGRVFGSAGDSVVADFASSVEAVRCAIAIQQHIAKDNIERSDEQPMLFRIGVNLGDVVVEGGNLLGDGVNVAARLESGADPGGIHIAGSVFEQVKGKLPIVFEDLGHRQFKNIADPVHVYRVPLESAPKVATPRTGDDSTGAKPGIAVLPFANMSGDEEQEYFADGLTEDVITALSAWRSFPVVSRHSSFAYKGKAVDVRRVSGELGVRYVLEGSVRRSGDRVRISAQLIDAAADQHVWAERFDRDLEDIFELQDEIAHRIAATLEPELERAELRRSVKSKPKDLDAWDYYQRGMSCMYEFCKEGNTKAREMFAHAIELDPTYSDAYTGLALSHHRDIFWSYVASLEPSLSQLKEAALTAVRLDNTSSYAHLVHGFACLWAREYDQAIEAEQQALELNPSNAFALVSLGNVLDLAGDPDEGIPKLERGLQLNPRDPRNHIFISNLARAHLNARHYDDAVQWARQATHRPPHPLKYLVLASALGHLGRTEEACIALDTLEHVQPGFVERWARRQVYRNRGDNSHVLEGLRKADCPRDVPGLEP